MYNNQFLNKQGNKIVSPLTTKGFFTDGGNTKGYFEKENFLFLLNRITPTDIQGLELAFESIKNGFPLNNAHIVRTDKAGIEYVMAEIKLPKGTHAYKVPIGGNLLNFIRDYQHGKITTSFTLQDLYDEACSVEAVA